MKKGFTLIELLAVIVVLAIIALIASPIIINIIDNAKKKVAIDSAYGYIEAVELQIGLDELEEEKNYSEKMIISDNPFLDSLKIKGKKPDSGMLTIDENNVIKKADLCIDDFYVLYENGEAVIKDGECDFSIEQSLAYKIMEDINEKNPNLNCSYENGAYSENCYFTGDRSKITTNKILYTGFIWNIVNIEPNGDLRLISEQPLTTISWGDSDNLDNSYVGRWLRAVFEEKIKDTSLYDSIKDITILSEEEYLKYNGTNSYLDTRTSMWLKDTTNGTVRIVSNTGGVMNANYNEAHGVRPVITISNDFVTGSGTYSDMYRIVTEKKENKKFKNGDFIKLSNDYTVRVIDNDSYKVILHGILSVNKDFKNYVYEGSNIENYLENTFAQEDVIKKYIDTEEHEFNIGKYELGGNFKTTSTEIYKGFIALPTIGELFSGSDLFIQIQNQNVVSYLPDLSNQNSNQWLLTPHLNGNYVIGYNGFEKVTNNNAYGIRPVFHLKNDIEIKSGDGSPLNPYILK